MDNVVDYAVSLAIRREMETNARAGVTLDDVLQAVDKIDQQHRGVDHSIELAEFAEEIEEKIVHARKVKPLMKVVA